VQQSLFWFWFQYMGFQLAESCMESQGLAEVVFGLEGALEESHPQQLQ
jgi:hypothetical protein